MLRRVRRISDGQLHNISSDVVNSRCFIVKFVLAGNARRRDASFKPDPSIKPIFSATNEDYLGSGWSRGHMAPAGNYKNDQARRSLLMY